MAKTGTAVVTHTYVSPDHQHCPHIIISAQPTTSLELPDLMILGQIHLISSQSTDLIFILRSCWPLRYKFDGGVGLIEMLQEHFQVSSSCLDTENILHQQITTHPIAWEQYLGVCFLGFPWRYLGSCRISDSLAQIKGDVVYRHVMPRPLDSRYATPTNSSYNI